MPSSDSSSTVGAAGAVASRVVRADPQRPQRSRNNVQIPRGMRMTRLELCWHQKTRLPNTLGSAAEQTRTAESLRTLSRQTAAANCHGLLSPHRLPSAPPTSHSIRDMVERVASPATYSVARFACSSVGCMRERWGVTARADEAMLNHHNCDCTVVAGDNELRQFTGPGL
jgi:hypothetical protein